MSKVVLKYLSDLAEELREEAEQARLEAVKLPANRNAEPWKVNGIRLAQLAAVLQTIQTIRLRRE